jgi:hypothetical protein
VAKHLTDIANNLNLTLTIAKPIRLTEKTTTEFDQIMTKLSAQLYNTEAIQSLLSDHYAQCIDCQMTLTVAIKYCKEERKISEANINSLCSLQQMKLGLKYTAKLMLERGKHSKPEQFYVRGYEIPFM